MELRRYLNLLRDRAWLVALALAAGVLAGYLITPTTPVYSATSRIYVGAREFRVEPNTGGLSSDRVSAVERLISTFARMVDSEVVAQDAIARTGVPRSSGAVVAATSATSDFATLLLNISVVDRDPAVAQALANGVADAFVDAVQAFEPGTAATEGTLPALPAYVFERARLPVVPRPNGLVRNLMLNGAFGLIAAVALIVLLAYLDLTIHSADDVERRLGLPVMGSIPLDEGRHPDARALLRSAWPAPRVEQRA
jgi:capsular polysaccharide biosynthesis protein